MRSATRAGHPRRVEGGCFLAIQRRELDQLALAVALQLLQGGRGGRLELAGPQRGDHVQVRAGRTADQVQQQLHRGRVRPVQVIDGQQDAAVAGGAGRRAASRSPGAGGSARCRPRSGRGRCRPRRARHAPGEPGQQARQLQALVGAAGGRAPRRKAPRRSLRAHPRKTPNGSSASNSAARPNTVRRPPSAAVRTRVGEQLRLADPGLAGDLDHVRLRRLAAGEQAVDLGQLTPANAQERRRPTALTPTCAPDPWYPTRPLPGFTPKMPRICVRATSLAGDVICTLPVIIRPNPMGSSQYDRGRFRLDRDGIADIGPVVSDVPNLKLGVD